MVGEPRLFSQARTGDNAWQRDPHPSLLPAGEKYSQVVLATRLREALVRLNPSLPAEAIDDAFRKVTRLEGATLDARNRTLHRLLVDGVTVEYRADGAIRGAQARLIDFDRSGQQRLARCQSIHCRRK